MNKDDLFKRLIEEGVLLTSGLDQNFNSYRIFRFKDKDFKLTLEVEGGEDE